jgi:hypothetical protein
MIKMTTLTMGGVTHEIVDEGARSDIDILEGKVEALEEADESISNDIKKVDEVVNNTLANAIRQVVSGNSVSATDISPVEHETKVRVHGKNFIDVSRYEVQDASKECTITEVGDGCIVIKTKDSYNGNGHCASDKTLREVCPQLKSGKQYVLTATSTAYMQSAYFSKANVYWDFGRSLFITEELLDCRFDFYGLASTKDQGTGNCVISNIQIEEGDTPTEYTPYIDPRTVTVTSNGTTYTPTQDGMVDGILSTALVDGISTDTEGVIVECEYNVDTKTYIDQKFAELQALIN